MVLSNHFVRYALLPWSDALATPAEEEAYLRHHFAKIHGERREGLGAARKRKRARRAAPCERVDAALIEAIRGLVPEGRQGEARVGAAGADGRLQSLARDAIPRAGAWLVIAEAERACVALHADGAFRSVQNGRGDWRTLLERERHRVAGETPNLALIDGAPAPSDDAYWKFSNAAT